MRTDSDIYPAYQDPKHTIHLIILLPTPLLSPTKNAMYDESYARGAYTWIVDQVVAVSNSEYSTRNNNRISNSRAA